MLTDHPPGAQARLAQRDAAILDSRAHGIEPVQLDGLLLAPTGIPHPQWNGAWFTAAPANLPAVLDEARQRFRSWGVPYGLVVPADLARQLDGPLGAAGARRLFPLGLMERELDGPPHIATPPGVLVRGAAGEEDYATLVALQVACFGDDEALWSSYLRDRYGRPDIVDLLAVTTETAPGAKAGTVVGSGTLVATGDAAGVYGIGVLRPWRRRGIGAALTAAVLAAAASCGCRVAHLNPSTAGLGTYRRLGFREVPGFSVWAPPA